MRGDGAVLKLPGPAKLFSLPAGTGDGVPHHLTVTDKEKYCRIRNKRLKAPDMLRQIGALLKA